MKKMHCVALFNIVTTVKFYKNKHDDIVTVTVLCSYVAHILSAMRMLNEMRRFPRSLF